MIRLRRANTVKDWLFREFLKANEDLNQLCRDHGWATATFLVPVIGGENEFVAEYEYPDFASFLKENAAQMSDPEFLAIFRASADLVYPQSALTELYQNAPDRRLSSIRRRNTARRKGSDRSLAEARAADGTSGMSSGSA